MKPEQSTVATVNNVSRISANTLIKGEIVSPNDIRIDGQFEGKLASQGRVVVGEGAIIKGDIVCCNIDVWGTVEGNAFVRDTFSLKDGGTINGNIQTRRLHIELESKFNGNCKMITEEEFDALSGDKQE